MESGGSVGLKRRLRRRRLAALVFWAAWGIGSVILVNHLNNHRWDHVGDYAVFALVVFVFSVGREAVSRRRPRPAPRAQVPPQRGLRRPSKADFATSALVGLVGAVVVPAVALSLASWEDPVSSALFIGVFFWLVTALAYFIHRVCNPPPIPTPSRAADQ
jgi:hypothetical protein